MPSQPNRQPTYREQLESILRESRKIGYIVLSPEQKATLIALVARELKREQQEG